MSLEPELFGQRVVLFLIDEGSKCNLLVLDLSLSYSLTGTFSSHNNGMEGEVMG